jgi:hypothetical protein
MAPPMTSALEPISPKTNAYPIGVDLLGVVYRVRR